MAGIHKRLRDKYHVETPEELMLVLYHHSTSWIHRESQKWLSTIKLEEAHTYSDDLKAMMKQAFGIDIDAVQAARTEKLTRSKEEKQDDNSIPASDRHEGSDEAQ